MKKNFIFNTTSTMMMLTTTSFIAASCSTLKDEKKQQSITLYFGNSESDKTEIKKLEEFLNSELIKNNYSNITVKIENTPDKDSVLIDNILKNNNNAIGFLSVGDYFLRYEELKLSSKLFLRTLTRAFKHVNENNEYAFKQAELQNNIFNGLASEENINNGSYERWNNDLLFKNYIYENVYSEPNDYVDSQRGQIWLYGDEATRNAIKEAWKNKDFNKFMSFGIIHGSKDSSSKWILPKHLLKTHFEEAFKNKQLDQYLIDNSDKFADQKAYKITDFEKSNNTFHIAFDNEAPYAYTKNTKKRYIPKDNNKFEIFVVTESVPYNLGVASNTISNEVLNVIQNSFLQLSNIKGNNNIGDSLGFNAYKKTIENEDNIIIEKMKKLGY
ncbi:High affinity transport system protein p37 precursor [Mycoplasmopsis maculosa]|uniref:High affinity transport system protein p37 n=1 Tax=Mycoplasmopsis maculosa TaxID=114885 RepID=A0A449B3G6_9BACT|nr:hypothetical protein [Mycoplasmopsis maculosa]VEU75144.1 High affinity transport system protein p37 precursor [Mycoplasmopsis maculosa]